MKNKKIILFLVLLSTHALAQEKEWEKNQTNIESLIFDVVGNKELKLNPANRLFDPIPPQSVNRVDIKLEYDFFQPTLGSSPAKVVLRPKMLSAETEEKLYGGYIRGGFGNFQNPFFDAYIANKREKEFSYGANLNYDYSYKGAVDEKNSADGNWGASVFANVYGDKVSLYSDVGYARQWLHFYGYDDSELVDPVDIEHSYDRIKFSVTAANADPTQDFQFNIRTGLYNQGDMNEAKETNLFTEIETETEVIENIFLDIEGAYRFIRREDFELSSTRNNLYVAGKVRFGKDNMDLYAGGRVDYNPDTLNGDKGLKFYPLAGIKYNISQDLVLFGDLSGGMQINTWMGLSLDNPFLLQSVHVNNTNNVIDIKGGLRGKLSYYLAYEAGFELSQLKNAAFFVNSEDDLSRFDILYDGGSVKRFNPYFSIKYNKNDIYRVTLRGDYYGYSTDRLEAAFHRPSYRLGMDTGIFLGEKVRLGSSVTMMGGIQYLEMGEVKELDPLVHLSLSAEYFTGPKLSAFLSGENLISSNYSLFYRYPVRGLQVRGGVTYRF